MGLQKAEEDEKFTTHQAYYQQAPDNAEVVILENVVEYTIKEYVAKYLGAEWECLERKVDPRLWGFGAARPRSYGIAWKTSACKWDPKFDLDAVLESLKARPQMTATSYFWMELPTSNLTTSQDFHLKLN